MTFTQNHKMRKIYENEESLANENRVKQLIEEIADCTLMKLPRKYSLDWAILRNDDFVAFAEYRRRFKWTWDSMRFQGGFYISLHKWKEATSWCWLTAKPFFIFLELDDGVYFADFKEPEEFESPYVRWMDRVNKKRGDWQDNEPMVVITMEKFALIEGIDEAISKANENEQK